MRRPIEELEAEIRLDEHRYRTGHSMDSSIGTCLTRS